MFWDGTFFCVFLIHQNLDWLFVHILICTLHLLSKIFYHVHFRLEKKNVSCEMLDWKHLSYACINSYHYLGTISIPEFYLLDVEFVNFLPSGFINLTEQVSGIERYLAVIQPVKSTYKCVQGTRSLEWLLQKKECTENSTS